MCRRPNLTIYIFTSADMSREQAKVQLTSSVGRAANLTRMKIKTLAVESGGARHYIPFTIGYDESEKRARRGGLMLFWHNVLVWAYMRDGRLADNDGVIAIAAVDFLLANSQKEFFEDSGDQLRIHRDTMERIQREVDLYIDENFPSTNSVRPLEENEPSQTWVVCDRCKTERQLPDGYDASRLPARFFCGSKPLPDWYGACWQGYAEGEPHPDPEEFDHVGDFTHGERVSGSAPASGTSAAAGGSAQSVDTIRVNDWFFVIHPYDDHKTDKIQFAPFVYRVSKLIKGSIHGKIIVQAGTKQKVETEVWIMERLCTPEDSPQNFWKRSKPSTHQFDLSKTTDWNAIREGRSQTIQQLANGRLGQQDFDTVLEALTEQYEIALSEQEAPAESLKLNDRNAEYRKGFADMMKVKSARPCSLPLAAVSGSCLHATDQDQLEYHRFGYEDRRRFVRAH